MKSPKFWLGTVGSAAVLAMSCSATWADTLSGDPLIGTSGDGLIFSDPEEGVLPPGVKAVTFTSSRDRDDETGEVINTGNQGEPVFSYENGPYPYYETDFESLGSRGDATNCLMANNPDIYCDSASGSGKRVKVQLTGPNPFDMTFQTVPGDVAATVSVGNIQGLTEIDTTSVDYFTFGKVSNFTGARMTGFELQLLDADGNLMGLLDPEAAVLFNLAATDLGLGSRLPDGLFGDGGNEGEIGFFSDARAGLALTSSDDVLGFVGVADANGVYLANFGTAFLDNTMVPEGLFWNDTPAPDDEDALVAWNNLAAGGWTYGTLAPVGVQTDNRLVELADALGVDLAVLTADYSDGGLVSPEIVAAAEANGLFSVDPIEDLRNANLNYTLTVGTVDGDQFTLRTAPSFAPIVNAAQSDLQFALAGYLDAAAEVPFWDVGNAEDYRTAIAGILALDPAAQADAVTSTGFGIAPAFSSLGLEAARDHVTALTNMAPLAESSVEVASQMGGAQSWLMGDGLYGLASIGGSKATYDATVSSTGYDVTSTSFTAGVERRLNPNIAVGFAVGGASATAEAAQDLGEIDATGLSLTAFTRSRFANGGSVQALVGYQDLSYDSARAVMGMTADGSTNGSQVFAALSVDYMRDFGAFKIGPTASIEYYDASVDGFTETGAGGFNLVVRDQSVSTLVSSIGVTGEYLLPGSSSNNRLIGNVAYTAMSGDDFDVQSGFVGLPSLTLATDGLDENLIEVGIGIESLLSSNTSRDVAVSAGYGGAFGDNYERHGVQVSVNFQF